MSQYSIIYKHGKRTGQLKIKWELKIYGGRRRSHRDAPELNEKEVTELLEDLSNILGAFLMKQLFHSHLSDMR